MYQAYDHPELLLRIQDLDADHRVSHDLFKNIKVSVLYDGAGECIVWYVQLLLLTESDTLQMDLKNLGASELLRYDFGHCTVDHVLFPFLSHSRVSSLRCGSWRSS